MEILGIGGFQYYILSSLLPPPRGQLSPQSHKAVLDALDMLDTFVNEATHGGSDYNTFETLFKFLCENKDLNYSPTIEGPFPYGTFAEKVGMDDFGPAVDFSPKNSMGWPTPDSRFTISSDHMDLIQKVYDFLNELKSYPIFQG